MRSSISCTPALANNPPPSDVIYMHDTFQAINEARSRARKRESESKQKISINRNGNIYLRAPSICVGKSNRFKGSRGHDISNAYWIEARREPWTSQIDITDLFRALYIKMLPTVSFVYFVNNTRRGLGAGKVLSQEQQHSWHVYSTPSSLPLSIALPVSTCNSFFCSTRCWSVGKDVLGLKFSLNRISSRFSLFFSWKQSS